MYNYLYFDIENVLSKQKLENKIKTVVNTRLQKKIENNSTYEGAFYQSE